MRSHTKMDEEAVCTHLAGAFWHTFSDEILAKGIGTSLQIFKRLHPGLGLDRSFCAVV